MEENKEHKKSADNKMYGKFGLMMLTSFVAMYLLMFINMDQIDHFQITLTRIYMAICMIAVMAVIMLLYMLGMYKNKKLNAAILVGSVIVFIGFLAMLRNQTFISDVQWMRGMIPHHSSAIMTSQMAHLEDPEAIKLSKEIIEAQKKEIAEMKKIIYRLEHLEE
jgi:ABC-type multidrug transport system fused ATPase/permease subunit